MSAAPSDPAPDLLVHVAASIVRRFHDVLGHDVSATFAPPAKRQDDEPDDDLSRAWSSNLKGSTIWCVVGTACQRFVLECALDGPGAQRQTTVERTIVGECLLRLLDSRAELWREVAPSTIELDDVWRCNITMTRADGATAHLRLYAPAEAAVASGAPSISDVPLDLVALLEPVRTSLGQMTGWQPGTRVLLRATGGTLRASLSIHSGFCVNGDLGVAETSRAIRLSGAAARSSGP